MGKDEVVEYSGVLLVSCRSPRRWEKGFEADRSAWRTRYLLCEPRCESLCRGLLLWLLRVEPAGRWLALSCQNGSVGKSKKEKEAKLKAEALLRAQQEEAERLERERLYREHLEKLEAKYQAERESELAELNSLEQKFLSAQQWKRDYREQAKWEHYLSCDGTPDPTEPQEINTFMSLWRDEQDEDVQLVMEKEEVVLNLIEKLEFLLLEASPEEITDKQKDQYQEVILQLQDLLHQKYNDATQNLLKIASMYEDSETGNMHTVLKDKNITFCIWANLKKKARFKDHMFQEAGHGFELPISLALSSVAVRMLHTHYDHVSPLWVQCQGLPRQEASDSMELAEHPEDTGQGPGEEEEEKGREEPSMPAAEETGSKERKESSASLKETSNNTDDFIKETEEETEKNSDILDAPSQEEDALLQEEPGGREEAPQVVDLEQLVPVGGVYHISALRLPPQAQDVGDWTMVELLDVGLEVYPYSPGEAEDGTQEAVQITLRLPDNVIYFKVPMVARWDPAGQQWRTDGISKITYEAEEKSITFSMSAFHTVALLQDAHLNLPYQAWEWHPTGVDEGLFTVTAVFATIQIQIKDNQCMLSSVVVEEEEVLSHITGKWMSPLALRAALKRAGVNIFPAEYSPKYVPVPRKAALAEVKAYEQMALLAAAFAFAHSKWNGEAGPEQVVFKVSEHLTASSAKGNNWSLFMFSGEKVQHLKLTETSETFSEELEEESEFHSTLYHMLKDSASNKAMDKVDRAGFLFIDSVYQLLLATRVLAYS
ncbi:dynein intermediate chain CFAP94, axonemal isoform X3 [Motacilla alba alba]|uniref:dynein intermediate chain CFAP94, axonemal isoform X3 n=1 Tax=Motacilla alba alba TaxID=1094192 RepID=UPI0018D56BFF|nr:dynein intermediate chain CFAP94, axonemal isoform X3 [Motacilla alba alba]